MAGSFYVHRAHKYVIHQHNKRIDSNNNDNNDNDNDITVVIKDAAKAMIFLFLPLLLELHFPISFAHNCQIFIDNVHFSYMS